MNIFKRTAYAFGWFKAVFAKPQNFQTVNFTLLESMADFLEQTAKYGRPMKTELKAGLDVKKLAKISYPYPAEDITMLHLWCGVDSRDSPFKRIAELVEENQKLKRDFDLLITNHYKANPPH